MSKELLEVGHQTLNLGNQLGNNGRYIWGSLHDLSLVQRYIRGRVNIHVHLGAWSGERITVSSNEFSGPICVDAHQKYSPVFVDVGKLIETPQGMASKVITSTVRLHEVNLCNHLWGKPRQSRPSCILERSRSVTDGERVLFAGYTIRGEHKFPYHEVECGTKIVQTVSDDQRKAGWQWSSECLPDGIREWIYLNDQTASVTLELPMHFRDESIVVLFGPEDFQND